MTALESALPSQPTHSHSSAGATGLGRNDRLSGAKANGRMAEPLVQVALAVGFQVSLPSPFDLRALAHLIAPLFDGV